MRKATVAIAGAGMVGSYLHRILDDSGIAADLYTTNGLRTSCGISPCAWGTSRPFFDLVRSAGLDPYDYVLRRADKVIFQGIELRGELLTFDKPRLIKDLQNGTRMTEGPLKGDGYERVIDATGTARAYLPPVHQDLTVPCVQYRVSGADLDPSAVYITYGNIGYSWSFPLSETEFHIGGGSIAVDPIEMVRKSGLLDHGGRTLCGCQGRVRISTPQSSAPFVNPNAGLGCEVWGVGEAIGVVAPIAGEGVVHGMRSARILQQCWDDPEKYTAKIKAEFPWMPTERRILEKLMAGGSPSMGDWRALMKMGRRMGADIGLKETISMLSR
jgi:flavin-dependent dehydrogenase